MSYKDNEALVKEIEAYLELEGFTFWREEGHVPDTTSLVEHCETVAFTAHDKGVWMTLSGYAMQQYGTREHHEVECTSMQSFMEAYLASCDVVKAWPSRVDIDKKAAAFRAALIARNACLSCDGSGYAGPDGHTCGRCEGSGYNEPKEELEVDYADDQGPEDYDDDDDWYSTSLS